MVKEDIGLHRIASLMKGMGASRIFFKLLANNDNSKNQIYFGSDFSVIQIFPCGDVSSCGVGGKGSIFKAPLRFSWISGSGESEPANGAQFILYPDYPEVRLSGVLKGCALAPSELMQAPTTESREDRTLHKRCMVLGIVEEKILAYVGSWGSILTLEAESAITDGTAVLAASVFYEFFLDPIDSRAEIIERLREIWRMGSIRSCRLNRHGQKIDYRASNGAGYTLESQFGITPNGISEPDFMGWEIKAHSRGAVTLMTPEPDSGSYLESLEGFLRNFGRESSPVRMDFAGRHRIGVENKKSRLILLLEGYDPITKKIVNPSRGLALRDVHGNLAAGWSFGKLISHWKRKHAKTCFVTYTKDGGADLACYGFGPLIVLGIGADLEKFLSGLYSSTIYYDPGINMKLVGGSWMPKKRNQFRISSSALGSIYESLEHIDLSKLA